MDGHFAMDLNELDQDIFIRLSAQGAAQDPVLDPALQICSPGVEFSWGIEWIYRSVP